MRALSRPFPHARLVSHPRLAPTAKSSAIDVERDVDLEEIYDRERHLHYVACARARDHLLVTGVKPASEFLDNLGG